MTFHHAHHPSSLLGEDLFGADASAMRRVLRVAGKTLGLSAGEMADRVVAPALRDIAHAVVVDFVTMLGRQPDEEGVATLLQDVAAVLFAPGRPLYRPAPPRPASPAGLPGESRPWQPLDELLDRRSFVVVAEDRRSFVVHVRHRDVELGELHVTGLEPPGFLDDFEPVALLVADAAALALNAERVHRREQELIASLRDKVRALDTFAHVASHDLQEPLRTVTAFVDLLVSDAGDVLPPAAVEDLEVIRDATVRMRTMVFALLDLSRARHQDLNLAPVALGTCVAEALSNLRASIEESGAVVQVRPLPTVRGDSRLLVHLFQNLLGNAVKFRGEARPVIRVAAVRSRGRVVFGVQDNGIGVDPKYAERIFEPFERLNGGARYPGSGIGLSVCRTIVERHGGRLWVEAIPGGGAHFRFTLNGQGLPRDPTPVEYRSAPRRPACAVEEEPFGDGGGI